MEKHYSKGFTLIELLVVVSIISMLSSIVSVALSEIRLKSRDSYRISQIHEVQNALALYYSKYGQYPDNITDFSMDLDDKIAKNWQNMMNILTDENLIQGGSYSENDSENSSRFSLINTAYALSATYWECSLQDPLYKDKDDFPYSYGYVASPDKKNYKIRVYLENINNPLFNDSITGAFLDTVIPPTVTTGPTACDKEYQYYCTMSVL